MMTNFDHILLVKHVQRHVQGQLGRRQGDKPLMVVNYIAGMGEIDLIDCTAPHVQCKLALLGTTSRQSLVGPKASVNVDPSSTPPRPSIN